MSVSMSRVARLLSMAVLWRYFHAEDRRYSPRAPTPVKAFRARSLQILGGVAAVGLSRCRRPLRAEGQADRARAIGTSQNDRAAAPVNPREHGPRGSRPSRGR